MQNLKYIFTIFTQSLFSQLSSPFTFTLQLENITSLFFLTNEKNKENKYSDVYIFY